MLSTQCTATADRLRAARIRLNSARTEGDQVRLTKRLLADLEAARKLCDGGEAALRRGIVSLEQVAQATHPAGGAIVSERAFDELVATTDAAAAALEREWRTWLTSATGGFAELWQGARALALAPPGGLSEGLDGLDGTRASLELARAHLDSAALVDALVERLRGGGASDVSPSLAVAESGGWSAKLHALLRAELVGKATAGLQLACRLAAHAATEPEVLLDALAEASTASAKAARAVASVHSMVPPVPPPAPPPSEPTSSAPSPSAPASAEAALALEMAGASDELLVLVRALPPPSSKGDARSAAIRKLADGATTLLRQQLDAVTRLVDAAHTVRGRRALAMLGEAGERLSSASLAQKDAEAEQ